VAYNLSAQLVAACYKQ